MATENDDDHAILSFRDLAAFVFEELFQLFFLGRLKLYLGIIHTP